MSAYYNEWDKKTADWLRELIKQKLIADGEVDERSIADVSADDIRRFDQCHFFAGIGGWSYALRLAGLPDNFSCWTASLPCQPFSVAGKGLGKDDERHLLPHFLELVRQCKPSIVFGEQVKGAIKHEWLDDLYTEMEASNYALGSAIIGAHSVGAPHIRQRIYWCAANIDSKRLPTRDVSRVVDKKNEVIKAWREFERVHATQTWKAREVESDVCVFMDGIPNYVEQIRGFGNAIVPQVAAEFISAFMELV